MSIVGFVYGDLEVANALALNHEEKKIFNTEVHWQEMEWKAWGPLYRTGIENVSIFIGGYQDCMGIDTSIG